MLQQLTPVLLLLTAMANAQSDVTSYFPVCPTASSTTVTVPNTVTYCPGPHCNGGGTGPMITTMPNGVGMPGVHVGEYTSVGTDGHTTVLGIWETVYDSMCSTGLVPATYTITAPCPCESTAHPTMMPEGFQTTVVPCHVCTQTGGPATVTLTTPCPTGQYATQTPNVGPAPAGAPAPMGSPAAPAAAAASAGANSGAAASAGPAGAVASAGSGASAIASAGGAAASAGSGSGAGASAGPAGGAAAASADSGASAMASVAAPPAAASSPVAPAAGRPMNSTMPAPASPKAPTSPYTGTGVRTSIGWLAALTGLAAAYFL